jgi:hypothetical protein
VVAICHGFWKTLDLHSIMGPNLQLNMEVMPFGEGTILTYKVFIGIFEECNESTLLFLVD